MDALILYLAMLGGLIGVFGRRSVAARRIGALLVSLDVVRRVYWFVPNLLAADGVLTVFNGAMLLFALLEVLVIRYFWRRPA